MTSGIIRAADPVVTCHDDLVRFESFSQCGGVYARADIEPQTLGGQPQQRGVINIDIGASLRSMLSRVRRGDSLRLQIHGDGIDASTASDSATEGVVRLPPRWLRGFAEAQLSQAVLEYRFALDRPTAQRFVRALPAHTADRAGKALWASPAPVGPPRLSASARHGVELGGPSRLAVVAPLLHLADHVAAFGTTESGIGSAWVVHLPGARVTVAMSADAARGFSGEGRAPTALVDVESLIVATELRRPLACDRRVPVTDSATRAGVRALAALGEMGYDVDDGSAFHRPLPGRALAADALHPRLRDAYRLVEDGAVFLLGSDRASVRSGGVDHTVQLGATPACTCPWGSRHGGERGPCKHELAARLALATPHQTGSD
jgi:hypothetical protein